LGEFVGDVKRPFRLCSPVDKNGEGILDANTHLLCYKIRTHPRRPPFKGPLFISNQLDSLATDITRTVELCVPTLLNPTSPQPTATATAVATPTVQPTPVAGCSVPCTTSGECPQDPFGGDACVCRTEAGGGSVCAANTIYTFSIGCAVSGDCPSGTFCFAPFQNGTLPGTCVACCGTDPAVSTMCPDGRTVCGSVGSAGTECCAEGESCVFNPTTGAGVCQ
jgi:hypothetical protein